MGAVRWLRRLQYLAAALAVTMAAVPVRAQTDNSPSGPMLRINAPGHTAPIRGIATDAAERFAVTASDDKTVRVWSLPDGKLQRVICLPSGTGDFGKAYAVALSPDGSTIAVGGWTTPPGFNGNIYLFDRASGALVQRLPGLPNVVIHLEFSPDGKRLAAALEERTAFVCSTWLTAINPCPVTVIMAPVATGSISTTPTAWFQRASMGLCGSMRLIAMTGRPFRKPRCPGSQGPLPSRSRPTASISRLVTMTPRRCVCCVTRT